MTKTCTGCNEEKSINDFYKQAPAKGNYAPMSKCKRCYQDYQENYRKRHPDKSKLWSKKGHRTNLLKKFYGLSQEAYAQMVLAQKNLCAICSKPERASDGHGSIRPLAVDHNHTTGQVRGLLCSGCNGAIGIFGEDIKVLESAIAYLRKHNG